MATDDNISLPLLNKKVENLSEITAHFNNILKELNDIKRENARLGINMDGLAETVHRNYERMSYDNRQYQKQIARDASQALEQIENDIIRSSTNKFDSLHMNMTHIFVDETERAIDKRFKLEFNFNQQLNNSRLLIEADLIIMGSFIELSPIWTYGGIEYEGFTIVSDENANLPNDVAVLSVNCVINSNFPSGSHSLKLFLKTSTFYDKNKQKITNS